MKLLKQLHDAGFELATHVGYDGYIFDYLIEARSENSFWQPFDEDEQISWADEEEDILEDTGNQYTSETRGIWRGEEITLALVVSDFNSEKYWLVLDSKKEIK